MTVSADADLERVAARLKLKPEHVDALRYLPPDDKRRLLTLVEEEQRVGAGAMDEPLSFRDFVDRVTGGRFKWYRYALVLCTVLQRVADGILKRVMILAPPRHGKLCASSTPILTPDGWRTHGDLRPGDYVYHPSGKPVRVVAVSAPDVANVRMTFSSGESVLCHEAHEWTVYDRSAGKRDYFTYEARHFLRRTIRGAASCLSHRDGEKIRAKYQLPPIAAVETDEATLPLHPYILGAWLGDGTTGGSDITHAASDSAIVDKVTALGLTPSARHVHATTGVITTAFAGRVYHGGELCNALRALGVWKEKRIPAKYQRASVAQRLELMAGLVDTDGHVEPSTSRVRIVTGSQALAADIHELATSLGWHPYITSQAPTLSSSGIQGRLTIYTVGFQPDRALPVALERKRIRRFAPRRRQSITAVERVDGEPGQCIQVDSPDGLYLVGRTLIPTHNSELVSRLFPAYYLYRHPARWVGHCSYAYELSATMSRSARANYRAFYGERDESDGSSAGHAQAVKQWETGGGGGMWASGIGGGQLGKGWHLGIIDDPVKNAQEAQSETIAHRNKEWYQSTFYTRQEPDAALVLVMQRWPGASDFAGYLLDEEYAAAGDITDTASPDELASGDERAADDEAAERWHIVNFDALRASPTELATWSAREGKPLFPSTCTVEPDWRQPGEALSPERYPAEKLRRFRKRIGTYYFAALFQQRPRARADSLLQPDWFIPVDRVPDVPGVVRVRAWDFAGTPALPDGGDNPAGAYTVGVLLARVPLQPGEVGHLSDEGGETMRYRFYFEDLVRGQWSPRDRDRRIKQTANADRGKYGRVLQHGEQEPADAGIVQAEAFKALLHGHVVSTQRATGDKVVRAGPLIAAAEAHTVFMVRAPWNPTARREIGEFPHADRKDVVDGLSSAYNKLSSIRQRKPLSGTHSQKSLR